MTWFGAGRGCSRFWVEIITAPKLGVLPPTLGGSKWRSELGHREDTGAERGDFLQPSLTSACWASKGR